MQGNKLRDGAKGIINRRAANKERKMALLQDVWILLFILQ